MFDIFFSYVYRFLQRYLGMRRHLPKSARTLIWMIGLYDFNFALSSVFINIFLFKKQGDWDTVGFYNLAMYAAIVPAFWLGGHLSKKWGDWVPYQLGFGFNGMVFLAVLIWRENAPSYPIVLGLMAGLGIGFYYLGQHSLTLDLTHSKTRDYFLSLSMFLSSVLRILAPAMAGCLIEVFRSPRLGDSLANSSTGYYVVFTIALLIYVSLAIKSLQMRLKPKGGKFEYWRVLTLSHNLNWNRQMGAQFILGLRNGVFWFVVAILVYRVSQSEAIVGSYSMMGNFLAVLTAYGLSLWAGAKNRERGLWISALLGCASCVFLAWKIDYFSLITYAVLNAAGVTWFQVVFSALCFTVLEKAKEARPRKLEYLAIRELPLGLGRILGLSIFLIGQSYFGEAGLQIALVVFGFMHMGVFFLLPVPKKS
jgi:YQGE family putative transporter